MSGESVIEQQHSARRAGHRLFSGLLCLCVALACLPMPGLAEEGAAQEELPSLVLRMPGEALEDDDFFIEGTVEADGVSVKATLRNLTDKTNRSAAKCDYFLRVQEGGALLGVGETGEYLLLGGGDDKSLIRNYLGYRLAEGIFDDAPGYRLCELTLRTAAGEDYQGVYLLVEKKTADTAVLFYHGTRENGIAIDTYSSLNGVTAGRMYIPPLESARWDDRYSDVIGRVSTAESVLYSTNSATFYTYMDLFDVPSFVGRFLLGELMEEYTGVTDGYFTYDTATGLFSAAPIWDFQHALDNETATVADATDIRYDAATYYEQLFKSHQFATQVQSTYLALRRTVLDEQRLMAMIDEAARLVAPAVQRDWERWDNYSHHGLSPVMELDRTAETARDIAFFTRQSSTYEEEILRLKVQLREHSLNMAFNLTGFDFSEKEISKEIVLNSNPAWLVLFLVVFFSLIRFARRYGV